MAGTLILLYALQSIFGCIPQSIFVVAWVLLVVKLLASMINYVTKAVKDDEKRR